MPITIDRPILGLNWKIDSKSIIALKGSDLTSVNSVVIYYYAPSGTVVASWKSTKIRVTANGKILFAVMKSIALPVAPPAPPPSPPGLSDVSVTVTDSGSGSSATETIEADIYED